MKIRNILLNNYNDKTINDVFKQYNIDNSEVTEGMSLNWEQVKEMSRHPNVTIASHTATHSCLKYLTTEQLKEDVIGSVQRLESQIQKKVEHFSYPFGQKQNGKREFAILTELGFKTATTTRFANIFLEHWQHRCSLPRIYQLGRLPLVKYLDVVCSGTLSALLYRFRKVFQPFHP